MMGTVANRSFQPDGNKRETHGPLDLADAVELGRAGLVRLGPQLGPELLHDLAQLLLALRLQGAAGQRHDGHSPRSRSNASIVSSWSSPRFLAISQNMTRCLLPAVGPAAVYPATGA